MKRLIALFVALTLVLGCLTGCSVLRWLFEDDETEDPYTYEESEQYVDSKTESLSSNTSKPNAESSSSAPASKNPVVKIDGEDVSSKLTFKTINGVLYAEGKELAEFYHTEDMQHLVYEYNPDDKTIFLSSWATEVIIFELKIGSTKVQRLVDVMNDTYKTISIGEPPLLENGVVYLPVKALTEMVESSVSIS